MNDIANLAKTLWHILKVFKIEYRMIGFEEVKLGHINSTYKVYVKTPEQQLKTYIVQKINTYVFTNPKAVMRNIDLVTSFIRELYPNKTIHFHHTIQGKNYYIYGTEFWRLYTYINAEPIEGEINENIMYQCGCAFGDFQNVLNKFPTSKLTETIKDFHNTKQRYMHFLLTVDNDPLDRVEECKDEISFLKSVKNYGLDISYQNEINTFPIRPTHNDTKTNNVLIDIKSKEPLMVIDLDTVMPGLVMHDFGDAIRYGANTASEDETDLSKVSLSLPLFEAFTKGYLEKTKDILTKVEVDYLVKGAINMTFECGMRFLDDYIDGDKYFKISYPKHNLDRAKCQFALLKDMISKIDKMDAIVRKYSTL